MRKQIIYILTVILLFATAHATAQNESYSSIENKGYSIVNIENNGVRQFMNDRSYDNPSLVGNYNFSVVKKYSKGYPSKPDGIRVSWTRIHAIEEISTIAVMLVESEEERVVSPFDGDMIYEDVKYFFPDIHNNDYLLCNMRPKMYCYYQIIEILKNGQKVLLKKGQFYTTGRVRMLRVDGMVNVRDFGGWKTSFGKPVAYGKLFRGNRPEGITSVGRNDFVKNEHISVDLDLRGSNLSKSPMGPVDEVEYYCTNNARYKLAITGNTRPLVKDLETIATVLCRGGNVFLHCNHGANRAGTLSFIIEGILGLSEADLSREYELSSFAYGLSRTKSLGEMFPVIRSYGKPGDDLAQCFYNFALSIGVSEDALDTIRSVMLEIPQDDPLILKAHRR